VDAFFAERDELRGMLNCGNVRGEAHVMRTEETQQNGTRGFAVKRFSVFGPKVFAGIGKLAETLADRSIVIPMRRKRSDEKRDRFRRRDCSTRNRFARNASAGQNDHAEELRASASHTSRMS
jgi:putative DNA primase/helicase